MIFGSGVSRRSFAWTACAGDMPPASRRRMDAISDLHGTPPDVGTDQAAVGAVSQR
jgi:hypothetical protein